MDVFIFYLFFSSWGIMNLGTSYGRKMYNSGFNYGSRDLVTIDPSKRRTELFSKDMNNLEPISKFEQWYSPKIHDRVNVDPNKRQIEIFPKDAVNNKESVSKPGKWYDPKIIERVKVDSNKRQIEILSKNVETNSAPVSDFEKWYSPKIHDRVNVDPNKKQIEIFPKDAVDNSESVSKPGKGYDPKIIERVKVDSNKRQIEILSKDVNNPAPVSKPGKRYDLKIYDRVKVDPYKKQIEILPKGSIVNSPASATKPDNWYDLVFHDEKIKVYPNKKQSETLSKDVNSYKFETKPINWPKPKQIVSKYSTDETINSNLNIYEPKDLSMNIGKHVIKVSSHSYSRQPESEYPENTQNSKHHVIEISRNDEKSQQMSKSDSFIQDTDTTESYGSIKIESQNVDLINSDEVTDKLNSNEETVEARAGNEGTDSHFNDEFQGSGEDAFNNDIENDLESHKSGRLFDIFSRQNETSPVCITPKNETGRCRRLRTCLLSDALDNFNVFLQYMCLVRGAIVGMCCPDNPVIEIVNPDENSTESDIKEEIKQPPEGCGLNTKTRIVGGSISVPHEWSWMVALMRRNRFYCGGVIINNWYVLTAAHCVMGIDMKDLSVRLGEYNFSTNKEHKEDISVSEIKRHAQFVTLTFQHDIALLKLRRSINYSKFVGSICLPSVTSRDYSDARGMVVGWGTVSFGGAASPILRQVEIPVWKNEDCDKTYLLENIDDSFMCAGSPEKGEDACQGDSGGPLMTLNDKGRWEVIGIVSWGRRCGDPTYPGVYTRITTYVDWITQNAI